MGAYLAFRKSFGASTKVHFHPRTGAPDLVTGFSAPTSLRDPEAAARSFLDANAAFLKVDSKELTLSLRRGPHLLFQQSHNGIPVEFSRIGVHADALDVEVIL